MTPCEVETGRVAGAGDVSLRTRVWAPRESRGRVLVVHGLGEHAGRYAALAEALAERGYGVLAYDQRGHGESEGRRGWVDRFERLVEDLVRVRAALDGSLPGEGPPFLYGHSMGGLVVLRYLQTRRPEARGVVLSAPWMGSASPVPAAKLALAAVLRRLAPAFPVRTDLDPGQLTRDPDLQRGYVEDPLVGRHISVALYDAVLEAQRLALAGGVGDRPALVLLPGEDTVADADVTSRWAAALGEGVEVLRLPGFRHEPHSEVGREAVFARVADWMDARSRAGP